MNKEFKVLLVEDLITDAQIAQREIFKMYPEAIIKVVDKKNDFLNLLSDFKPNIIISDYSMPEFNGMDAMLLAKDRMPLTPFIMLTGSMNEETAVECMKAGAWDYVIKEHIRRLGPAIQQSLIKKDILTEKYEAEEKIRNYNEKIKSIFEASSVGIGLLYDRIILEINPRICEMTDYSKQELLGQNARLLYNSEEEFQRVGELLYKEMENGSHATTETIWRKKNGELINILLSGVYLDNKKKQKGLTVIAMEITDRKIAEKALRDSEEKHRLLFDNLNIGVGYFDLDGRLILFNQQALNYMNGTLEDFIGKSVFELYGEENGKIYFNRLKTTIENDKPYIFEDKVTIPAGTFIFHSTYTCLKNDNSQIIGVQIISQDITEKRHAEISLIESERRLNSFIESDSDLISIKDENLKIILANKTFIEFVGKPKEEIIGKTAFDILDPIMAENCLKTDQQSLMENKLVVSIEKVGNKYLESRKFPLQLSNNKTGVGAIIRDITEKIKGEKIQTVQFRIADAMINASNVNVLFAIVKEELNTLIDTSNFYIAFYDKRRGLLRSPFLKDEKDIIEEWPAEQSLTGIVVKEKKSLLLKKKDILDFAEKGIIKLIGSRAECWMGVPLISNQEAFGAMVVQNYNDPQAYTSLDLEIFEIISKQFSSYIELKETEEKAIKLTKAVEQSPVSVVITDKDANIQYVNSAFTSVTGYSFSEVIGENPRVLQSGFHTKELYTNLWNTLLSKNDWKGELLNKKKNGALYWENVVISAITNDQGEIINYLAIKEDITEKKKILDDLIRAKETAEENEYFLRESQKAGNIGSYLLNFKTGMWTSSEILDSIFGIEDSYIKSINGWLDIVYPDDREMMKEYLYLNVMTKKESFNKEYRIKRISDHEVRWLHGLGNLEYDLDGNLKSMIGTIQDITDRKNAEKELKIAKEKAEESDRLKSSFLNNISHEIRTPLNGIMGFVELLDDPNLSVDEAKSYYDIIKDCGLQLANVVTDTVNMSMIEQGQEKAVPREFSIYQMMKRTSIQYEEIRSNKNVTFLTNINIPENIMAYTDDVKLKQVIDNLLNNAFKFTTKGEVILSCFADDTKLHVSVKDTGLGIDSKFHEFIFNRFTKIENDKSVLFRGTGLGLSICKAYCEMLGGKIGVISELGSGSEFIVEIPLLLTKKNF